MVKFKTGELILCNSQFTINKYLKMSKVELLIPELVFRKNHVSTGYTWFSIWGDIEKSQYIELLLCFNAKNSIVEVHIHPHNVKEQAIDYNRYINELDNINKYVTDWFHKYESEETKSYHWGSVYHVLGNSDYEPSIIIRYKTTSV